MKKTGAWLAVHALEQLGVRYTFGIPGVHNTELYDALNNSKQITPILVTHEGGAAFMADALSRVSDGIGTLAIVPAAGFTHAAMSDDGAVAAAIREARSIAAAGRPVIVAVAIDYSKRTAFTRGVMKTNFRRFPLAQRLRMAARALTRRLSS